MASATRAETSAEEPGELSEPARLSAQEVATRWRTRLRGRRFSAKVRLHYDFSGKREERELVVWRDDEGGRERLMARFESPAEMRGFAILYLEQQNRPNDYFVYQPATRRVRRIAESMASQDIYGIDLEFLGFGIAQTEPTQIESAERTELDGVSVYRLIERATRRNQRFDRRTVYLDAKHFVPLRVEHERAGKKVLVATSEKIEVIQGIPTPVRSRFERPLQSSVVVMEIEEIDYERAIPELFFSTMALMR